MLLVGMISTSFFALKALSVPIILVLKNVTNFFTICGDYILYGKVFAARDTATLNKSDRDIPWTHECHEQGPGTDSVMAYGAVQG